MRFLSILCICFSVLAQAQLAPNAINEKTFLSHTRSAFPLLRNSLLDVQLAGLRVDESMSPFGPMLEGSLGTKAFDGKDYYSIFQSRIAAQSTFGVRFEGGLLQNNGLYLNPENNLPPQGLVFAGVEVPLGAGLFTDKSRTAMRQERNNLTASQAVNQLVINDILYEAGASFWEFYQGKELVSLAEEALALASTRKDFVNQQARIGEYAMIDTLEAHINQQNRRAFLEEQKTDFNTTAQIFQVYSWNISNEGAAQSLMVDEQYDFPKPNLDSALSFIWSHPVFTLYSMDSMNNALENKLAKEYFKPKLDLTLRLLEKPSGVAEGINPSENYYVGGKAQMPLLLRQERAKAKATKLKSEIIENKKILKQKELQTKTMAIVENVTLLKSQAELWRANTVNYRQMLDAEVQRFNLGESSLFRVNIREMQWMESKMKYITAYSKYRKEILKFYHNLALLPAIFEES